MIAQSGAMPGAARRDHAMDCHHGDPIAAFVYFLAGWEGPTRRCDLGLSAHALVRLDERRLRRFRRFRACPAHGRAERRRDSALWAASAAGFLVCWWLGRNRFEERRGCGTTGKKTRLRGIETATGDRGQSPGRKTGKEETAYAAARTERFCDSATINSISAKATFQSI